MRLIDADEALRSLSDDLPYKDSVRRVLARRPKAERCPMCNRPLDWGKDGNG